MKGMKNVKSKMKIKALAPWFGGKRNRACRIIEQLGVHRVYWEPFCGSMAVLMVKRPCEMETVNDLNGDLINLAKVIQDKDSAFKLYDKVSRTLYSEQLFLEAKERCFGIEYDYGTDHVQRAYDFFVASWMGLNGMSGTMRCNYQFAMRWCVGGGQGAKRWQSVVESMPAWHKRLRNVVIVQRDAFDLLDNIKDETGVSIYCDPPYFEKSSKYIHDLRGDDHLRLCESLQRFKEAKVVVSYYDHPDLTDLYKGWHRISLPTAHTSLSNATNGGKKVIKKKQTELLLVNSGGEEGKLF